MDPRGLIRKKNDELHGNNRGHDNADQRQGNTETGVYVHIPFCPVKCLYCDFLSYPGRVEAEGDAYLQALLSEARLVWKEMAAYSVSSLYIGGGTPTCLSGGQLTFLLSNLRKELPLTKGAEITVEANPGTVDREKLGILKSQGANRLSLGVQSFLPRELSCLGRIHTVDDVYNTYSLARRVGFDNISLDLMYGLPGQTLGDWRTSLREAQALEPEHLSLYQLHVEEGTPLGERRKQGLWPDFDQELARAMYQEAQDVLGAAGYEHYEISNFAVPGRQSRHNRRYWLNQQYLGLGAGASGYLEGVRYTNHGDLAEYDRLIRLNIKPRAQTEVIGRELAMAEQMFLGLRLIKGVDKRVFRRRFSQDLNQVYGQTVADLKEKGLLTETDSHVFLTREGLCLANRVFIEFL